MNQISRLVSKFNMSYISSLINCSFNRLESTGWIIADASNNNWPSKNLKETGEFYVYDKISENRDTLKLNQESWPLNEKISNYSILFTVSEPINHTHTHTHMSY